MFRIILKKGSIFKRGHTVSETTVRPYMVQVSKLYFILYSEKHFRYGVSIGYPVYYSADYFTYRKLCGYKIKICIVF